MEHGGGFYTYAYVHSSDTEYHVTNLRRKYHIANLRRNFYMAMRFYGMFAHVVNLWFVA